MLLPVDVVEQHGCCCSLAQLKLHKTYADYFSSPLRLFITRRWQKKNPKPVFLIYLKSKTKLASSTLPDRVKKFHLRELLGNKRTKQKWLDICFQKEKWGKPNHHTLLGSEVMPENVLTSACMKLFQLKLCTVSCLSQTIWDALGSHEDVFEERVALCSVHWRLLYQDKHIIKMNAQTQGEHDQFSFHFYIAWTGHFRCMTSVHKCFRKPCMIHFIIYIFIFMKLQLH